MWHSSSCHPQTKFRQLNELAGLMDDTLPLLQDTRIWYRSVECGAQPKPHASLSGFFFFWNKEECWPQSDPGSALLTLWDTSGSSALWALLLHIFWLEVKLCPSREVSFPDCPLMSSIHLPVHSDHLLYRILLTMAFFLPYLCRSAVAPLPHLSHRASWLHLWLLLSWFHLEV